MQTESVNITSYMCELVGKEAERIRLIPNGTATSVVVPNETEGEIARKIFCDAMAYLEDDIQDPDDASQLFIPLARAFYAGMGCAHAWDNHVIPLENCEKAIEYLTRTNGIVGLDDFVAATLALNKKETDFIRLQLILVTWTILIRPISDIISKTGFRVIRPCCIILLAGAEAMFALGVTCYAQRTKKRKPRCRGMA